MLKSSFTLARLSALYTRDLLFRKRADIVFVVGDDDMNFNLNNIRYSKFLCDVENYFIEKGYSICIFPEKDYLDEKILLNSFKKGAFKLAIEHQLPVFPLVFYDCKRKFPWHTNFGYSGSLRIKALKLVSTNGMSEKNINLLSLEVYQKIETQLLIDPKKTAIEAIELWNRYKP